MSVRDGLLAILTIGPAYGHQLHGELRRRAVHRGPVNVGQIYTTIERVTRQKLVEQHGSTDDGLPEYRLTPEGRVAAMTWMTVPVGVPSSDWTEMLDQLLITSTIDVSSARALAASFHGAWRRELAAATLRSPEPDAATDGPYGAAVAARAAFATAAIGWLDSFAGELDARTAFGFAESRPIRGRRPSSRPSEGATLGSS